MLDYGTKMPNEMTNISGLCRSATSFVARNLITGSGLICKPTGYRGFYDVCRLLGRLVDQNSTYIVHLDEDSQMVVKLADLYWARIISL